MRLVSVSPEAVIGRTIIFRHQYWRVAAVTPEAIHLDKWATSEKGRLRHHQWSNCRLYPDLDEVSAKYPRLIYCLRQACLLTALEAANAIQGYITTGRDYMGAEAVAHVGGAGRAIEHALRCRHFALKMRRIH